MKETNTFRDSNKSFVSDRIVLKQPLFYVDIFCFLFGHFEDEEDSPRQTPFGFTYFIVEQFESELRQIPLENKRFKSVKEGFPFFQ